MIKLKKLLKESTWKNRKFGEPLPTMADYKKAHNEGKLNEKTGGQKTYKSLMKLEKGIKDLERNFNRDRRDMDSDRAKNVRKSLVNLQMAWNAIWADFQER